MRLNPTDTVGVAVTVFLCGDVMPGRGVDQILPHPGDPTLVERGVTDARVYVKLAERVNGPVPCPAEPAWPWGEALSLLERLAPDVRVLNLETSITADGEFARGKVVHYRMSPGNIGCLTAVVPDVCVLANNHVLDFGRAGLADTLRALSAAGLRQVGAGRDATEATQPALISVHSGQSVTVAAGGTESAGVPRHWAAGSHRPGVAFLGDLSDRSADELAARVRGPNRPNTGIASLHWGSNWGYDVEPSQVRFAHRLIERGVDIVHGHSSHHPRPIEVYRRRLILYGCGDTIDDYEGIRGHEEYRDDLRLLYFATVAADGTLISLRMAPMRARNLRLRHAPSEDAEWLQAVLDHLSRPFRTRVDRDRDGWLTVHPR